jgi:hypothetical protein
MVSSVRLPPSNRSVCGSQAVEIAEFAPTGFEKARGSSFRLNPTGIGIAEANHVVSVI